VSFSPLLFVLRQLLLLLLPFSTSLIASPFLRVARNETRRTSLGGLRGPGTAWAGGRGAVEGILST